MSISTQDVQLHPRVWLPAGILTSGGHVEHGRHLVHPPVRLLPFWSVLLSTLPCLPSPALPYGPCTVCHALPCPALPYTP